MANIQSKGCQMVQYAKCLFYFHNAGHWLRHWYSEASSYGANSNCITFFFSLPTVLVYWYVVSCFLHNVQVLWGRSRCISDVFVWCYQWWVHDPRSMTRILKLYSRTTTYQWCGIELSYSEYLGYLCVSEEWNWIHKMEIFVQRIFPANLTFVCLSTLSFSSIIFPHVSFIS